MIFTVVDAPQAGQLVHEFGEEDERDAYPSPFNSVGFFFEDYFDSKPEAVTTL